MIKNTLYFFRIASLSSGFSSLFSFVQILTTTLNDNTDFLSGSELPLAASPLASGKASSQVSDADLWIGMLIILMIVMVVMMILLMFEDDDGRENVDVDLVIFVEEKQNFLVAPL